MSDRTDTSCNDECVNAIRDAREYMRRFDEFARTEGSTGLGKLQTAWTHMEALVNAAESLAADAAETASLREETQTLREAAKVCGQVIREASASHGRLSFLWCRSVRRAWRYRAERGAAVADRNRLAEAAHDLNEYASNKAGYWQHPLTEKARAHFAALAGREGGDCG